jgi:hypothetical protein
MKNNNLDNNKCYKIIRDLSKLCDVCDCRHFLKSEKDLNCSIIAAQDGPKTLQEIGDYYGISRMRVCQIEKAILKKLKKDSKPITSILSG